MSIKPKKVTASTFKKLAKCVRFKFPDGRVVHSHKSLAIEGAPGMGKTCLIQSVAEDWELPCITVAINQWSNAADIVGFTYKGRRNRDGSFDLEGVDDIPAWLPVYREAPNGERVETNDSTKGYPVWHDEQGQAVPHPAVILLDEFSAAIPKIQQTFLTVCLAKKVKNFSLHPDTTFFIAFNGAKRKGFVGQTFEISEALVGPNARFDVVELTFEEKPILEAVRKNSIITDFWKRFSDKYLKDLKIYNENDVNDSNSCGRTWEDLMERLSIGGFDSKCWNDIATLTVEMAFSTSPKVAEKFLTCVENFDVPTGIDYLQGKVEVKTFSDAIIGVKAIVSLFGFRKRCEEKVIVSTKENAIFQAFMDKEYPTGTVKANGQKIIGSRQELYMILKSALYQESLECLAEFSWVAGVLDDYENGSSSTENEEESCEF